MQPLWMGWTSKQDQKQEGDIKTESQVPGDLKNIHKNLNQTKTIVTPLFMCEQMSYMLEKSIIVASYFPQVYRTHDLKNHYPKLYLNCHLCFCPYISPPIVFFFKNRIFTIITLLLLVSF